MYLSLPIRHRAKDNFLRKEFKHFSCIFNSKAYSRCYKNSKLDEMEIILYVHKMSLKTKGFDTKGLCKVYRSCRTAKYKYENPIMYVADMMMVCLHMSRVDAKNV